MEDQMSDLTFRTDVAFLQGPGEPGSTSQRGNCWCNRKSYTAIPKEMNLTGLGVYVCTYTRHSREVWDPETDEESLAWRAW